ncbi:MAG: T9SS type A sorting domain-containing protein [Bacteroidetes bacterium]|nr:T9SS type A sorting domain-containing protein [Bacteroidota bacterium]
MTMRIALLWALFAVFSPPATAQDLCELEVGTAAGSIGGLQNGTVANARFYFPYGLAMDTQGNLYVADRNNHCIRRITPQGEVSTLAGGQAPGFLDGTGGAARFYFPSGITTDPDGNVYVTEYGSHRVRKVTPAGVVTTVAGGGSVSVDGGSFADGTGVFARFNSPMGIVRDAEGNLYVADVGNHRIRKVSPQGVVTTLAGLAAGYVDGPLNTARFNFPHGLGIDAAGDLYVADTYNHRIRRISLSTDGEVTTMAGNGEEAFRDSLNPLQASFRFPNQVLIDVHGNLIVADTYNNRIRLVSPTTGVTTLAGGSPEGYVEGNAADARFRNPSGLAGEPLMGLYIADESNHRIRKLSCGWPAGRVQARELRISAFPNPVRHTVQITHPAGPLTISLWDCRGQLLQQTGTAGAVQTSLDMTPYATGIYLVKVQQGEHHSTLRIVKE